MKGSWGPATAPTSFWENLQHTEVCVDDERQCVRGSHGFHAHPRTGADPRLRARALRCASSCRTRSAWDEAEELPRSLVGTLAEAGFLAAGLPEDLGGGGLDSVSYCLLCEELGKADSSVRGIVSVSNGLFGKTVAKWGTEEQKQELLPRLASGEGLGCYALTEPGCGSDAAALATRAERDGDEWVLTGSKVFITLGSWAETAIVFARTGGEGPKGISAFLVPTASSGFEARPMKGKLGLRAQDTAELSLDGVRVPAGAMLGAEGEGFKVAMSALDNGRISLAAGCVGIAQGCLDASRRLRRGSARRSRRRSPPSSSSSSSSPRCTSRPRPRAC